jgi:uncharacterized protein YndB with AHSA1/START domain
VETKINLDIVVPDAPERVWQALTDRRSLADWLMPNNFAPVLGREFRFTPDGGRPILCEVAEMVENVRLAYWWNDGESGAPSMVTWTLTPTDGGTRVCLEHRLVETTVIVHMEATHNWRLAYASLPVQLTLERFPVRPPVLYPDQPTTVDFGQRLMGLRQREVVTC